MVIYESILNEMIAKLWCKNFNVMNAVLAINIFYCIKCPKDEGYYAERLTFW